MLKDLHQDLMILLSLTLKTASRGAFKNKQTQPKPSKKKKSQPKLFKGFECFVILSEYVFLSPKVLKIELLRTVYS